MLTSVVDNNAQKQDGRESVALREEAKAELLMCKGRRPGHQEKQPKKGKNRNSRQFQNKNNQRQNKPRRRRCRGRVISLDPEGRAVLITGCDSGFGNLLAQRLLSMGFTVFATCLFPDGEGAQSLKRYSSPDQLKIVRLNVSSEKEMADAKEFVQNNLPEKGLWGIVNNAGISTWGLSEWHSMDKYKKIVDINLLGSIRTTITFAPLIRKSKGRMVFMSSTNALITFMNGIYSMTKAGLEKFCDSLRLEMKHFGVGVSIIEPGNYARATNIQPCSSAEDVWNSLPEHIQEIYGKEYVKDLTDVVNRELNKGSDKGFEVIDAIVDALTVQTPKPRYLVASIKEKIAVYLSVVLPTFLSDSLLFLLIKKRNI
ncbi:D-beta-hydroxybutyrate dehydrogenase, mitochondrial-like [Rhinophrynus dorsalis]